MLNVLFVLISGCLNPGSAISRPNVPTPTMTSSVSDDVQYHVLRAMMYAEDGNWIACNTHFEFAAKRRPHDPYLHLHWGDAALKLGQYKSAVRRYREALGRFGVHRSDLRVQIQFKIKEANQSM